MLTILVPCLPMLRVTLLLIFLAISLGACAHVVSNLPDKMTDRIQRDWACEEMHGTLIDRAPRWETWDVVACGRAMRISCPHGAHSRWRRCRYEDPGDVVEEGSSPSVGVVVPPPGATGANAAVVRAALDARRAAILACGEGRAVTLDLAWTLPGAPPTLEIAGAPAGTPAHGCVRAVLDGLALPAPRGARLRHVVTP